MGLDKGAQSPFRKYGRIWLLPVIVIVISVTISMGGEDARLLLKYDRLAIEAGQYWRLLSGHFAHLGNSHMLLNAAGLVLVWFLVGERAPAWVWAIVLVWSIACIDLGFWLFDTRLIWYVGLSGVLHGLLVSGAIAGLAEARGESLLLLAIVFGKLAYEQIAGPLPGSESTSGGPVVVNAHLYGALAGVVAGLLMWRSVAGPKPI